MPIRWRLTIFNALAIGGILLVLGFTVFFLVRQTLLSGVEETTRSRAMDAASTIRSGDKLGPDDREELTLDGVFVIIRDRRGGVINQTIGLSTDSEARDTLWREALQRGKPASGTAALSDQAPDYVYAVPVTTPDGSARIVEAGKSYESARKSLEAVGIVLAAGFGTALLVAIAGAYLLARTALRPVDAVVDSAREMSEADLSRRLPVVNRGDEIGRLATTINGFLARNEAAFRRREETLSRQRRFASDASHELRNPLTAIRGHARMLDEWVLEKDPNTARKSVRAIRSESDRMRDLIEGLLALTRGDESAPMEIGSHDLGEVVGEATKMAKTAANGKVSIEYAPRKVEATFDRERIRQVISILLDNAVKYTPDGGRVTVRVRDKEGGAEIEISDTGIGIPEDQLPLVFERFHRVDEARSGGGAGLGLSIARQIAEAHGGRIDARSEPGVGSTFILLLPKKRQI